jgi:hypothetical protein
VTESRSLDRKLKSLPPDLFRHQDLAIALAWSRRGSGDRGEQGRPGGSDGIRASSSAEAVRSLALRLGTRIMAMEIEGTTFGTITIDGKTYEHDVIIRLSGEVVKRKKKLSKKY